MRRLLSIRFVLILLALSFSLSPYAQKKTQRKTKCDSAEENLCCHETEDDLTSEVGSSEEKKECCANQGGAQSRYL